MQNKTIEITEHQLYSQLRKILPKKAAKTIAVHQGWRRPRWHKRLLRNNLYGETHQLSTVRLLDFLGCELTAREQVLLANNGGKYRVSRKATA